MPQRQERSVGSSEPPWPMTSVVAWAKVTEGKAMEAEGCAAVIDQQNQLIDIQNTTLGT